MWLLDYKIDGLRLDAIHAISDDQFPLELKAHIKAAMPPDRHVHIIVENERNSAKLLEKGINAQWNDDFHHVLHHLLTGENEWYYADYSQNATQKLVRCLRDGFIYQGEMSQKGQPKGEPSSHLSPTAFVVFLQNHDHIGNRPFGERLTSLANINALKAAVVLQLLSPMIPLLFMGEEHGSEQPFLFFVDYDESLAEAVHKGRREEFAQLSAFRDPILQAKIPDPNSITTFNRSILHYPQLASAPHSDWIGFYRRLLYLRRQHIIPVLPVTRVSNVNELADKAVMAEWRLGDDALLTILVNLSSERLPIDLHWARSHVLFSHNIADQDFDKNIFPAHSALAVMIPANH